MSIITVVSNVKIEIHRARIREVMVVDLVALAKR